jgi:hypothetical protein
MSSTNFDVAPQQYSGNKIASADLDIRHSPPIFGIAE